MQKKKNNNSPIEENVEPKAAEVVTSGIIANLCYETFCGGAQGGGEGDRRRDQRPNIGYPDMSATVTSNIALAVVGGMVHQSPTSRVQ